MSPASSERTGGSAHAGAASVWTLSLIVTLVMAAPVLRGTPLTDALRVWACLLAYIAVPGALVYDRWRARSEDALLAAGMAWTIGLCLEALAYISCKAFGVAQFFALYPAVVLLLELVLRRRHPDDPPPRNAPRVSAAEIWPLCVLFVLVVLRTPHYAGSAWWTGMNEDLLFHAGNAAELRNNWPMLDPRCAGQPLVYHFFSYALPASTSALTGLPVSDVMYGAGAFVNPVFLALQIYNAGRLYANSRLSGVIAAALVMLHVDYGRALAFALEQLGVGSDHGVRLGFNSYLHVGVYASTSTSSGLMLFATLAILLHRWYSGMRGISIKTAACMALVGGVASGVKGSIMPVLLGGLGLVFGWRLVRGRTVDRRTLSALILLTAAALPMTVFLSSGEQTFVASMFRIEPGAAIRTSDTLITGAGLIGASPDSVSWVVLAALLPPWLAGYLDLIGAGALLFWLRERKRLESAPAVLGACAIAGGGAALFYIASDLSQMFFLYTAQIGLAILAGAGLAPYVRPHAARERRGGLLLAVAALPLVAGALHDAKTKLMKPALRSAPATVAYGEGLAWIRRELPPDAVVVAAHPAILVSAFAERRALYETDRFTPAGHAAGWSRQGGHWRHELSPGKAHPEYAGLGKQVCGTAPATAIEHVKKLLAPGAPLYVVCDDVRLRGDSSALEIAPREALAKTELPAGWRLEFSNDVMHVYRVPRP